MHYADANEERSGAATQRNGARVKETGRLVFVIRVASGSDARSGTGTGSSSRVRRGGGL